VNHQKARAIFLDPGEGDTGSLEALRAVFLDDSVLGKSEDSFGSSIAAASSCIAGCTAFR